MIVRFDDEVLRSSLALEALVEREFSPNLTGEESLRNIPGNLVSVLGLVEEERLPSGESVGTWSTGTGLLLTTNGFILTAYHVISRFLPELTRIREEDPCPEDSRGGDRWLSDMKERYAALTLDGTRYALDPYLIAYSEGHDLALVKAVIDPPLPISPARMLLADADPQQGETIRLFGMESDVESERIQVFGQYGKVICSAMQPQWLRTGSETVATYDTFLTDAYAVPGFSGGAFANSEGELSGIVLYKNGPPGERVGKAGGAKPSGIAQIVRSLADDLKSRA